MAHQNLPGVVTIPHGAMVGESSINPPFASLKERDQAIQDNLEEAETTNTSSSQANFRNNEMVSFQHAMDLAGQTRDTLNSIPGPNGQDLYIQKNYKHTFLNHYPHKNIEQMSSHAHGLEYDWDLIGHNWPTSKTIIALPDHLPYRWGAGIYSFENASHYGVGPYLTHKRYRWYGHRFGVYTYQSGYNLIVRGQVSYARETRVNLWVIWRRYQ